MWSEGGVRPSNALYCWQSWSAVLQKLVEFLRAAYKRVIAHPPGEQNGYIVLRALCRLVSSFEIRKGTIAISSQAGYHVADLLVDSALRPDPLCAQPLRAAHHVFRLRPNLGNACNFACHLEIFDQRQHES